MLSILRISFV